MIVYPQGTAIYQTLFRIHGSALYKGALPAILSTGFLIVLIYTLDEPTSLLNERWFFHPYPIAALIAAFTFLLTFKCSFSYNRYWEACTALQQMQSKWIDVAMTLAAWHLQSRRYDECKPPSFGSYPHINSIIRTRERIHTVTPNMLEGMLQKKSADELMDGSSSVGREQKSFFNWKYLKKHKKKKSPTSDGTPNLKGSKSTNSLRLRVPQIAEKRSIESVSSDRTPFGGKMENKRFNLSKITSQAKLDGGIEEEVPSLFLQEAAHLISLLSAVAFTTLRNDLHKAPSPLQEYIPGAPWPPVDPDDENALAQGLHYFEMSPARRTINYLLGNIRTPAQRTLYNACRPFTVLGGVSDAEVDTLQRARGPGAKTALCSMWLQEFISREYENGALGKTAPPIVSRIYQFCSDGMLGYHQARKVAYVPFPFPHAQLTTFYVVVVAFFLPFLMITFVPAIGACTVLNTLTVGVFVGLWQVSNELEDPFRNVPNDLPLNFFQAQFNETLLTMFAGYHPDSFWTIEKEKIVVDDHGPSDAEVSTLP